MDTTKPLQGIRILEISTAVAIPSCGRILAYLGADVIKIEPVAGDSYRNVYTPYVTSAEGDSPIFDMLNSQKRFVAANLKNPDVKQYILKLAEKSDVFLSNVRKAGLTRLGLDYETLSAVNPRLIYAHFSGYGETGPMADLPGYDSTAYLTRNGVYRDFVAEGCPPVTHIPGFGDVNCGLAMTASILCALLQRGATGRGQMVTASLNHVGAWNMLMALAYSQLGLKFCNPDSSPLCIMDASMRCKDGQWVLYSTATEKQWAGLLRALDLSAYLDDPALANNTLREENTGKLLPVFEAAFMRYTADEVVERLRQNDVPCERHRHVYEIAEDEQLWATDSVYRQTYSKQDVVLVNPPLSLSDADLTSHEKARPLGADTKNILLSLGCPEAALAAFAAAGDVHLG